MAGSLRNFEFQFGDFGSFKALSPGRKVQFAESYSQNCRASPVESMPVDCQKRHENGIYCSRNRVSRCSAKFFGEEAFLGTAKRPVRLPWRFAVPGDQRSSI